MLDVLASAGEPLCDDCIMAAIGWNNRQQAHALGTRLAGRSAIVRAHGICSRCGRRKVVNGLPLLAVTHAQVSDIKGHVTRGTSGAVEAEDEDAERLTAVASVTFGLERDLQNALRLDIEQLEPGLKIADGGSERETEAGRIDITAVDGEGSTVLIELTAGHAAPVALTHLMAHMRAVAEQDKVSVRGVLVAGEFDPRILSAAKATTNVQLRRYRYTFVFEAAE